MEKIINIDELIELIKKKLLKSQNKTTRKINSIEKKSVFLENSNYVGNIILESILIIVLALITLGLPITAITSIIFSFNNVNIYPDIIIALTGVPIPGTLFVLVIMWVRCLGETYEVFNKYIFEFFNEKYQLEKKLFSFIYDKKYQKLCKDSELLNKQLIDLEWFKDHYQYLFKNMMITKTINKRYLSNISKKLKKENLINVLFLLCRNNLKKLNDMEDYQKEKLKSKIIFVAEQVKKETNDIQQKITTRIENGERVRRIERYHVIEQAYDNVDKKIRRLSIKR